MNDFSINSPKLSNESVNIPASAVRSDAAISPPAIKKGVEFSNFGLHWLRVTIYEDVNRLVERFNDAFGGILGKMVELPYGWKGYKNSMGALLNTRIFYNPVNGGCYCTLDMPGQVCECVTPELIKEFFGHLGLDGIRWVPSRVDLKWDNVGFSPDDFYGAVKENAIRSLVKRGGKSQSMFEDGDGYKTYYFGSRTSERMLRIYDMRGYTRVEMEVKGARSNVVFRSLLAGDCDSWNMVAISHLRDFIDVYKPWWAEFVGKVNRAYVKITKAREICMTKIVNWLDSQVAPALSVVADCLGYELLQSVIKRGRRRNREKYVPVLSAFGALPVG